MNRKVVGVLFYVALVAAVLMLIFYLFGRTNDLSYAELTDLFRQEQVKSFQVKDRTITMELHNEYKGKTKLTAKLADVDAFRTEMMDLIQEQKDKKYDEISEAERKDLQECRDAIAAEEAKQKEVLATFAKGNAVIPQLIDLALLQSGLLKGSELNRFIKRSIELMK